VPGPQGPKGDPTYKRTILVSPVGTALQNGTALRNAFASIKDAASDKQDLLKIEPGSYDIGTTALAMKSWVDVEGSGNSRTLILGEVDAGALPLTAACTTEVNAAPFDALPAQVDVKAKNRSTAYRASDSANLDLAHADAADEGTLNDILWHAAKGARAKPPRAGVFR